MIDKLYYVDSKTVNPYENLAMEASLLEELRPGECILYLWQNKNTVVIGRNQNAWVECNIEKLTKDGGFLVRRLSGGGAVFHDLGNLNFTFLTTKEDYQVSKQMDVILEAVRRLGIHADKSSRNDITVNGRKFSGNAFYQKGNSCFHHGTIMAWVDRIKMQDYLTVSQEKLQSKGVTSVQSRVTNLMEYKPELTIEELKDSLMLSFSIIYQKAVLPFDLTRMDDRKKNQYLEQFSSWDWIYGKNITFEQEITKRFSWGEANLKLNMNAGKIKEIICYSDSLYPDLIQRIEESLPGCIYEKEAIKERIRRIPVTCAEEESIREDIAMLIP